MTGVVDRKQRLGVPNPPGAGLSVLVSAACLVGFAMSALAGGPGEGWIRIIARLRVPAPVTSEGIHAVQDSVLQALASAPYRLVRRFDTLPFLVLEVSPSALAVLRASSDVMGIEEDPLSAPQMTPQRPPPLPPGETRPPHG